MKLSKKLEAEVLKVYKAYWDAYLKGDMKTFASMLADDLTVFGTAVSEVFNNKKETLRFYKATADQLVGKAQFRGRQINVHTVDNNILVNEQSDFYFLMDGKWTYYGPARISAVFKQTNTGWKLAHQHASFPDTRADEGEQFATEKIKEENQQLRDAVKRRTVELEEKNRELEIESAVERVRATALAMHRSEDIHGVVRTLRNELFGLNLEGITGVTICLKQDDESIRLWDITDVGHTGRYGWDVSFDINKIDPRLWVSKIWKSKKKIIACEQDSNDLKRALKWLSGYDKKTADKITELLRVNKIRHGWHRAVKLANGRLISDFVNEPPAEIESVLLKMGAAFDLAYKRFLDLQKAEAQAREAQVEAALEKIRSRSLAMHHSSELKNVIAVLFEKLNELNVLLGTVAIQLFDHKSMNSYLWVGNAIQDPQMVNMPYDKKMMEENGYLKDGWKAMREGRDIINKEYSLKDKNRFFKYVFANNNLTEIPESAREVLRKIRKHIICVFTEKNSALFVDSFDGQFFSNESLAVIKRAGKVFEQCYIRFLDLQKAEAQAREAQIEAALERVRSRTMAMHQTSELQEVIHTVHNELLNLNLSIDGGSFVVINDDVGPELRCWGSGGTANTSEEVLVPHFNMPFCTNLMEGIKRKPGFFTEEFSQKEKKEYFTKLFKHKPWSDLSSEQKKATLSSLGGYTRSVAVSKHTTIFIINHHGRKFTEAENDILKRFAKVFEQTYTRFLDLQKAEAQARESQIQLAMERVRARTMAMQQSDELAETASLLFKQINDLGIQPWTSGFNIWEENDTSFIGYNPTPSGDIAAPYHIPLTENSFFKNIYEAKKRGEEFLVFESSGKSLAQTYQYMKTLPGVKEVLKGIEESGFQLPTFQINHCAFFSQGFLLFITLQAYPEAHDIFKRFAKVFEQTYTRFLDLQKAEAQAREAQIEAALERVRSRSMGMQKSDELKDVIQVVYEQFVHLNIHVEHTGFIMDYKTRNDMHIWLADKHVVPFQVTIPYFDCAHWNSFNEAKEKGIDFFANQLSFEEKNKFYHDLFKLIPGVPEETLEYYFSCPGLAISTVLLENVGLYIENFSGTPYTDEENNTLMRFGKVFQQTYTRFLDLQKAEAQTREAQIETALEKVRSRTMAMQRSEELGDVATVLFKELNHLVTNLWTCGFVLCEKDRAEDEWWLCTEGGFIPGFYLPNVGDRVHENLYKAWKDGETYHTEQVEGEELEQHYEWLMNIPVAKKIFDDFAAAGFEKPTWQKLHGAYFSKGYLCIITREPCPEEEIFKRFAQVFDLTYTRFLDLQKAEAQAREAQIELGLERVRARAMAMQKSDELSELVDTVFKELTKLDFALTWCIINIIDESSLSNTVWAANPDINKPPESYHMLFEDYPFHHAMMKGWKERRTRHVYVLEGQEKKIYDEYLFNDTEFRRVPAAAQAASRAMEKYVVTFSFSNFGGLQTVGDVPLSDANLDILSRFGKVFDLTYTRFNDLKQAEAQARESQIQLAMERVRARTMAMQRSDELAEVATILFQQVKALGVPQWVCGFGIWEIGDKEFTWYPGSPDGKILKPCKIPLTEHPVFISFDDSRKRGDELFVYEKEGEFQAGHYRYMQTIPGLRELLQNMLDAGLQFPTFQIDHIANFSHGNLVFITYEHFPEMHDIFKRFAKVFEQTYTRFLDLQKAEAQAREAQIEASLERVRSKTMAMHNSADLSETSSVLFYELRSLGIETIRSGFGIMDDKSETVELWLTTESNKEIETKILGVLPASAHAACTGFYNAWKKRDPYFNYELIGDEVKNYYEAISRYIHMPAREVFNEKEYINCFFFPEGSLNVITLTAFSDEEQNVMTRFARVFGVLYRRFLDLQKAEAQARESRIQLALERVRARTMAMQKSDELLETSLLLFQQVKELGETAAQVSIGIINEETGFVELSTTIHGHHLPRTLNVPIDDPYVMGKAVAAWRAKRESLILEIEGEELKTYNAWRNTFLETKVNFPEERWIVNIIFFSKGWLSFSSDKNIPDEIVELLKRFAAVFEQTYIRFNDLKQAEAQARESQIQLALERVRARTMAMHTSEELAETAQVMFHQLRDLGGIPDRIAIGVVDEEAGVVNFWSTDQTGSHIDKKFNARLDERTVLSKTYRAWKDQKKSLVVDLRGDDVIEWVKFAREEMGVIVKDEFIKDRRVHHFAFFSHGWILVTSHEPQSGETIQILERFASVFNLTYRRFLDLQKAEAQAKEAQIEAALERVRSRAMAMQTSEELNELIGTVFTELTKLDFVLTRSVILIYEGDEKGVRWWMANSEAPSTPMNFFVKYADLPFFNAYLKGWHERSLKWQYILEGEDKIRTDNVLFNETELSRLPDFVKAGMKANDTVYLSASFNNYGCLNLASLEPLPDEHFEILLRFAKVFDLTYTRFNDLKQAEAQAREAKIEAALERVRSRAMAMHKTDELLDAAELVYKELSALGITSMNVSYAFVDEQEKYGSYYSVNPVDGKTVPFPFVFPHTETKVMRSLLSSWKKQEPFNMIELDEEETLKHQTWIGEHIQNLITKNKIDIPFSVGAFLAVSPKKAVIYNFNFEQGYIFIIGSTRLTTEQQQMLLRFTKVFELAYRRFLDLTKAEAQAKEARIQLALERVRARTMAMQKSDELAEAAQLLYEEFRTLGINTFLCGYLFFKEEEHKQTAWVTGPDGILIPDFVDFPLEGDPVLDKRYEDWKQKKPLHVLELQGEANKEHHRFLSSKVADPKAHEIFSQIPDRIIFYCANFSAGYLFIIATEFLTQEEEDTIIRFAKVFELTYTRFSDLKQAEAQANEARIEIALERIRARALAMHKSDELMEVAKVLREQMAFLGQRELEASVVHLYEVDPDYIHSWRAVSIGVDSDSHITKGHIAIPKNCCEVVQEWMAKFYSDLKEYTIEISGTKQQEWYEILFKLAPDIVNSMRQENSIHEKRYYRFSKFSGGALLMVSKQEPSEEAIYLQRRAAVVFDLAYRRFSDLQKAEAQVREGQIEAALEKVRSRSLAMHKSDELQEVVNTVFERLADLNVEMDSCNIAIFKEGTRDYDYWIASPDQKRSAVFHVPYMDLVLTKDLVNARESGADFFTKSYSFEEKERWFAYAYEHSDFKFLTDERKRFVAESKALSISIAFSKNTGVQINRFSGNLPSEGEIDILKRFSKVFEQAYIRFLDLEKAEAQAREAQIEAALEKVRASAMAMHKSDDLHGAVTIMFEEFKKLSLDVLRCGIGILDKNSKTGAVWATSVSDNGPAIQISANESFDTHPLMSLIYERWQRQQDLDYVLQGQDLIDYYKAMSESDLKLPESQLIFSEDELKPQYYYAAMFTAGGLYAFRDKPFTAEAKKIMKRFASVVNLTYNRFLDLQKAEAQAREAQIEASLERVRSKTMAMHNSQDVADTVATMFDELVKLGIETMRCGVGILHEEHQIMELWTAKPNFHGKAELIIGKLDMTMHPLLSGGYTSWKNKQEGFYYELKEDDLIAYFDVINNYAGYAAKYDIASLPSKVFHYEFHFNEGTLFAFTLTRFSAESNQIFKRFAGLFGQTYRRYLDLQKAEANAREAQVEAALERVRAKAMAMHSSKDLAETLNVFYRELKSLSVTPIRCGVALMDKNTRRAELTTMNTTEHGDSVEIIGTIKMAGHPVLDGVFENWLKQEEYHTVLRGNQIKEYYQVLKPQISYLDYSHDDVQFGYYFMFNEGDVYAWTEKELMEDELTIYRRFTSVISLTYKRYKDLQQAEAQAREAKIEAGLERVRARTMAMHSSDDVSVATATMFTELEKLGVQNFRGGITNILANRTQDVWSVNNLAEGKVVKAVGTFSIDAHPFWQFMFKEWEEKKDFVYYFLEGQEKEEYIKVLNANESYLPQALQQFPDVHFQVYYFNEGAVWTNSLQQHSDEEKQIMKRFTSVFSLTFRRYQDLKKAEAQAREAQIEAGLERVRARTMAMHSSDDVSAATATMFTELERLGIESFRGGILNIRADQTMDVWSVNNLTEGKHVRAAGEFDMTMHPFWQELYKGWLNKDEVLYFDMSGKVKEDYMRILDARRDYLPTGIQLLPDSYIQSYYFGEGYVWTFSLQPHSEEDKQIMKRFASVFSLTFRRYQDLKKAEAQAREATIEAALEKVRGKAMAMHNSNDLSVTASMIISELRKLGISPIRCGVGIINKETHKGQLYTAASSPEGDSLSVVGWVLLKGHPVLETIYEKWVQGEDYYPELSGDSRKSYYEQLLAGLSIPIPEFKDDQIHYGHFFSFSVGCLYAWSEVKYNDDEIKILKRFASIIDLTFRRYFELQKAEENAKETVKQAALDRIRADIASMRTIGDLDRITPLIWKELTILGIPFIRCGVFIMDETQKLIHTFLSTPEGKAIAAFHLPYDTPGNIAKVIDNWRYKKIYVDHWGEEEFIQFAEILTKQGALISREQYLNTIPRGGFYLHFLPFLQGMLYVGNTEQLREEQIELIQHVADAFSTAYARYEDFNRLEAAKQQVENTLTDLKQAQQQLVQSEKMASLGELTAGIAHEIQNPLNFVNNFSDVSNELLEEMKNELEKGNKEDAIAIVEDVKQNLEKILHHGKRADAIVKGMLQHSRTSSGQKEPTDINVLTDEYLRLSFHGLRAKDKSFNAKFETHFDNSIGKINVIPQDIGRVILNLINNAFYAVTEKKKHVSADSASNGYEPTVTVTTKKENGKIEIKVKDNGSGIPQKVLDKIFQPFFTTKPTGQGTGLGLSLAYDIVTKGHGGELKVETREGEGTEFIIQIPVSKTPES